VYKVNGLVSAIIFETGYERKAVYLNDLKGSSQLCETIELKKDEKIVFVEFKTSKKGKL
jgi:hypothetical protein